MEFRVEIKKLMRATMRRCYGSVRNHPCLVGLAYLLFLLYRSFPLLFSLLISASPVLVCTAALLGILLSFGQQNVPEIEKEEKATHDDDDIATLISSRILGNSKVFNRDGNSIVELLIKRGIREKGIEQDDLVSSPLINPEVVVLEKVKDENGAENGEEVESETMDTHVGNLKGSKEKEVGDNTKSHDGKEVENDIDAELKKEKRGSINSHIERPKGSKAKGIYDEEDEGDEDDSESLGSGSDRAERFSTDTSIDGISPLLDELDPLLHGDEATPYVPLSNNGSDVTSEQSHKSSYSTVESNDGIEDEEGEDGEEEEEAEAHKGNEDGSNSAITWTEDDQKNLMDLGTLELERNQQLENLIARRKGRQNLSLMADMNLIDLDGSDHLPLRVPPIATKRRNPFDGASDSYISTGLPPVPGSAPSLPRTRRRNPFDLPYDPSNEEKIGGFQQEEFMNFQPRDSLFCRHESFSTGPSNFGDLRPYFVPENIASEATSYHSLERQSSEASESKESSVADTESVLSSSVDHDDKRVVGLENLKETEQVDNTDQVSLVVEHGRVASEAGDAQDIIEEDEVEKTLGGDGETHHQPEPSSPQEENVDAPLNTDVVEEVNSSRSSSSVYSELNEKIDAVKKEEGLSRTSDANIEEPSFEKDLEFSFVTGMMDDKHHKEPLYDSSPPTGEGYLSFSSDSSDMQLESSDEVAQVKDHHHPNAKNGNTEDNSRVVPKTIGNEHALNPSTSMGNDLIYEEDLHQEHPDNINSSTSDMKKYLEDSSMSHPEAQQPSSCSSSSSIPEYVENRAMHTEGPFVSNEDHDTELGDQFRDHMLSDASHEPSDSLVLREASEEPDYTAEDSLHEEDSILSDQDQVQRPTSDALTAAGSTQDLGAEREPSFTLTESTEQINGTEEGSDDEGGTEEIHDDDEGAEEIHDDDEGRESVAVSTLTSKSPSFSSGSSDYNTPMAGFNFRDHFSSADFEFEFGGFSNMSEQYEHYKEGFGSQVVYETMNEVVDDMREIDDELLSDSDVVGDLRANEGGGEVIEDGHSVSGSSDENSIDGGDMNNTVQGTEPAETQVEQRCLDEDIHEEKETAAIEKSAESLTEAIQNQSDLDEQRDPNTAESNLRLEGADAEVVLPTENSTEEAGSSSNLNALVKARSLKDIHTLMKRLLEDSKEDLPKEAESEAKPYHEIKQTGEVDEIQSTEAARDIESDVQEISAVSHQEPKDVSDETTETPRSRRSNSTDKKQRKEAKQPILFCFHVAMRDSSSWAAVACIDNNGDLLKAWSDNFAAATSQEGEALAALKAIQLALVDQQPTLFLGGDTRDIVEGIKSSSSSEPSNLPHDVSRIIDAAKTFLLSFRCWDVFYISEPDNFIAQNLANWAYSVKHVGPIDVSSLPGHVLARESREN